jgi:hypothetical protein
VLLDIDAVRAASIPVNGEGIWDALHHLRALKNAVFYNSITERTKGLFR